jgi:hypothetical protein
MAMRKEEVMIKTHRLTVIGLSVVLFALAVFTARPALAASGTVTGTIFVQIQNGQYCGPGFFGDHDCTGAMYVKDCPPGRECQGAYNDQTRYNDWTRVKHASVYVYSVGAGYIGFGQTDDAGYFNINWSYRYDLPHPDQSYVAWYPLNSESRFSVRYTNGSLRPYPTWTVTLQDGQTYNFLGMAWGTDDWNNTYWAAAMAWYTNMMYMGGLQNQYWVEIRGFTDLAIPGFVDEACPTSCGLGAHKIKLGANAGFSPQTRVMHEMGHTAIRTEKEWKGYYSGSYDYGDGSEGEWSYDTYEYKATAWEEANASFLADSTLYWPNAPEPYTCDRGKNDYCDPAGLSSYSLELHWPCIAEGGRQPISGMRMLWDIWDDIPDGNDNVSEGSNYWWRIWDVLSYYPAGTGATQADAPWDANRTTWTEPDQRSGELYGYHYLNTYGVITSQVRTQNCYP